MKNKTGWIGRMALKDKNLNEAQRKFIADLDVIEDYPKTLPKKCRGCDKFPCGESTWCGEVYCGDK